MPGVPPDAVDNVKRLLKGIFRRGKNKKQGKVAEQQQQQPVSQPTTSPTNQQSATNGTAPAIDKPLPPTHPLATGEHDKPQEAVPQNHSAQPGPEPSAQDAKKSESQGVGSAPLAAIVAPESGAAESDKPPIPPPKNDGAFDAPKPIVTSGDKENVPTTTAAPPSDSAIATPNTPAKASGVTEETKAEPMSTPSATNAQTNTAAEEKVPIHVESALPKTNPAAPGMSATSGPLEDFPEGMAIDKD